MSRRRTGIPVLALALSCSAAGAPAADRLVDGATSDWCFALDGSPRDDDRVVRLGCGRCGTPEPLACTIDDDCPPAHACAGSQHELVWYDSRTDSVANDLRTVAFAQDTFALYVIIDFHKGLDPLLLATVQIALDVRPGGTHGLVDPLGVMVAPGRCSGSVDRACTRDTDCHFCTRSVEFPSCCDDGSCEPGETCRVRICGSGCDGEDPLDVCDTSQTCEDLGTTPIGTVGLGASAPTEADYLIAYDLWRWFVGIYDAARLSRWTGTWTPLGTFQVENRPPGTPERPPALGFETAIPWNAFGCTGWTSGEGCGAAPTPSGCGCPDFGPGTPFSFTTVVSRAGAMADFVPGGAIEDVASEEVAGATTLTTSSCPGPGIGTTRCEIADGSTDTFAPETVLSPGGATSGLRIARAGAGDTPSLTLRWNPSCSLGDDDYDVYAGYLDSLPVYDHAPILCGTSGETTATFDAAPGNLYYLIVPTDGTEEGSYGANWAGAPRPPPAGACRPQVSAFSCP